MESDDSAAGGGCGACGTTRGERMLMRDAARRTCALFATGLILQRAMQRPNAQDISSRSNTTRDSD